MVRVRFAPSPTGNLHVGNARTALFNYLLARRESGRFVLRIEDTDIERSEALFEESIKEDLEWLCLNWDDGPYRQSDRLDVYRSHARELLDKGFAYKCFCTKEELEKAREEAVRRGRPPRYRGTCRSLAEKDVQDFEARSTPFVLRFKALERTITFKDMIRGPMVFPPDHVDDFIILKTDGTPSYNFAAAVDDLLMDITHVVRGSDHLSNTPKQIMLFLAFGKEAPTYAHHSLLIGADRKPLSKRHGATRVTEFRAMGILPEALVNYLGIIGRKVDQELMGQNQLIENFSLHALSVSDSVFDLEKLLWLNKEHMRAMDPNVLLERLGLPSTYRERVVLLRENARTLSELLSLLQIFEAAGVAKEALSYLAGMNHGEAAASALKDLFEGGHRDFEALLEAARNRSALPRKELMMLLRIAITGRKSGPPLKEVYQLVPKHIILSRVECLAKHLSGPSKI